MSNGYRWSQKMESGFAGSTNNHTLKVHDWASHKPFLINALRGWTAMISDAERR